MNQQFHEAGKPRSTSFLLRLASALVVVVALCAASVPQQAFADASATDLVAGVPASERHVALAKLPAVEMPSGLLLTDSGEVLWGRKPDQRRAMASITKVMTAFVALDEADVNDQVKITSAVTSPGESSAGLRPGETLSLERLIEATLVKSGNDASIAVALHVGGTEDKFVALMNAKAKELGLKHTHFANPHGLDAKGHYTTAEDLGKLARVAMKDPRFRRVVRMKSVEVDGQRLDTSNRLLLDYPGANGIKTGFTNDAGYSLLSSAKRGRVSLIAVVLGTPSEDARFDESRSLLDWGFQHYGPRSLGRAGAYVGRVPVSDYLDVDVGAVVSADASATLLDVRGPVTDTLRLVPSIDAPVEAGEKVGSVAYAQDGKVVATVPLVASRDVAAPRFFERVSIAATRMWLKLSGRG